jgi:putative membrane protein
MSATDDPPLPPSLPPDLGEMRTVMAADRTLMAWIRTSLSMLSFGFTIYKVLQGLQEAGKALHPNAPQKAGLFLTGMGVLAMVLGTVQYRMTMKDLNKLDRFWTGRPALIMAMILSVLGVFLFFSILTKLL